MYTYSFENQLTFLDFFHQFIEGKQTGFSKIYRAFYPLLLRHGQQITSDDFVIQSSIQEAFLKAWSFRQRFTSIGHTYRFIRLNLTWLCYSYYRKPANRFHGKLILTDWANGLSERSQYQHWDEQEAFTWKLNEERLQTIYKALPYLPADRQTILLLHYKYGLTHRQIAKRFGTGHQTVHLELQKGIAFLQKVIHQSSSRLKKTALKLPTETASYPECLHGEMLQLFRLRYEQKLGFAAIAEQMNLSVSYVQQQYLAAHRLLKTLQAS